MSEYFRADIILMTEKYEIDAKTGEVLGCDPDTFQDHGIIESFSAGTLKELIAKIDHLSNYTIVENTLEGSREVNNTIETYRIYIYKVQESGITELELENEVENAIK